MISNLPLELESEILSRVPATCLSQLRFTCKRWFVLFKDPRFIKKNFGKAATQMVLKKDQSVYSFSFNLHKISNRFEQFIEFTGKLTSLKDSQDVTISEIFHCEGLLLCTTEDNNLVVWNPCTGQTRWIQIQSRTSRSCKRYKYFLGYGNKNKSCDGYKVLRYGYYIDQSAIVADFEIYEFNSDSWRVLDVATHNRCLFTTRGVSLKGNTYWPLDPSYEEDTDLLNFILRFDFTTERFGRLPLPFDSHYDDEFAVLSVVREEKLAFLRQMYDPDFGIKVWITNTNKTDDAQDFSWSEFLLVDFSKLKIYSLMENMSFLVDEENKMVMFYGTDYEDENGAKIYIVGEDIHKPVYQEAAKESRIHRPLLVSYVPSLVQIPATQSNPGGK